MSDAFYIAATGMQTQQLNVDTIANNLANLNTTGFKKSRVSFTDLVALDGPAGRAGATGSAASSDTASMAVAHAGIGVGVASVARLFDPGSLTQTGSAWDIAVRGDGFLQVTLADGTTAYTRGGSLKVNADGQLATQSGQVLKPAIAIPANATAVAIDADGTVKVSMPNQAKPIQAGQLQLVRFANPSGLLGQGDNLYASTDASGEPIAAAAGQDGAGSLQQGFLEGSNVRMVDEMVNLMVAQRAYEASVKVVQASDEMLGMVNNLRK